MDQTISRRSALKTGTLSALGVGLMTAAGSAPLPAAAEPASAPDLLTALCHQTAAQDAVWFTEWLADWTADGARMSREHDEIVEQLKAYVPEDRQHKLVNKLSDVAGDRAAQEHRREWELLMRHLPGLEPTLRLLRQHIMETHFGREVECGNGNCRDGF